MHPAIATARPDIERLCRRYHVKRLDLIGSAAGERFDANRSDFDFVVSFAGVDGLGPADQYFGLLADLERLLGRHVDLIEDEAVTGTYFRRSIDTSREVIFA